MRFSIEELYSKIKTELKSRPKELTSLERWLFVAVNTARSIIDNTDKNCLDMAEKFSDCDSTGQIQYEFDRIQGKFGREGFSQRYSPNYLYLCSLIANFINQTLSSKERELIKQYGTFRDYLLYEL